MTHRSASHLASLIAIGSGQSRSSQFARRRVQKIYASCTLPLSRSHRSRLMSSHISHTMQEEPAIRALANFLHEPVTLSRDTHAQRPMQAHHSPLLPSIHPECPPPPTLFIPQTTKITPDHPIDPPPERPIKPIPLLIPAPILLHDGPIPNNAARLRRTGRAPADEPADNGKRAQDFRCEGRLRGKGLGDGP
jgi:hypothetical protein